MKSGEFKKTYWSLTLLITINFFAFIFFVEIFAGLVSIIHNLNEAESFKTSRDNELRIIVLGESISADGQAEFDSWPKKLQQKLIQSGVNAAVYNLAKVGQNTFMLLEDFKRKFVLLKPDIVISMMGRNDSSYLTIDNFIAIDKSKILRMFFWYRIFNYTQFQNINFKDENNLEAHLIQDYQFNFSELAERGKIDFAIRKYVARDKLVTRRAEKLIIQLDNLKFPEIKLALEEMKKKYPADFSYIIYYAATKLDFRSNLNSQLQLLDFLIENQILDEFTISRKIQGLASLRKYNECFNFAKKITDMNSDQLSLKITTSLLQCVDPNEKNIEKWEELMSAQKNGLKFHFSEKLNQVKTSHNLLYELTKNKSQLFVVQYPLKPIQSMKEYFSVEIRKNIHFISNDENFKKILKTKSREDLFTDDMGEGFAHTTDFGNEIISNKLKNEILRFIKHE